MPSGRDHGKLDSCETMDGRSQKKMLVPTAKRCYGGLRHVDSDASGSDEESLKKAKEVVTYSKEPEWAEAELLT